MLKSLYPNIDWEKIKIVGFDMDGTLYDELDFIAQVYKPIASLLAQVCSANSLQVYKIMLHRWLEKGSSYPFIFDEVLASHGINERFRKEHIDECLQIFRSFKPNLQLSERVSVLLDYFKRDFNLFLVTDGSFKLQSAKFDALGLDRWFQPENVAISGYYGRGYEKPSTLLLDKISLLHNKDIKANQVVFFGDREVDREFASKAQFQFVHVNCLRMR